MTELAAMTKLPEPKEVRDLLTDLLDRPVDLTLTGPYLPGLAERATYAVYVDDRLGIRAVAVADLPFSAYAGGALGLLPPAGVQDAVEEKLLSPAVEENFYEVLNICAALMNAEGVPHVKLYAVHSTSEMVPPDIAGLTQIFGRRLDLQLSVGGYGTGRISLVVVA